MVRPGRRAFNPTYEGEKLQHCSRSGPHKIASATPARRIVRGPRAGCHWQLVCQYKENRITTGGQAASATPPTGGAAHLPFQPRPSAFNHLRNSARCARVMFRNADFARTRFWFLFGFTSPDALAAAVTLEYWPRK